MIQTNTLCRLRGLCVEEFYFTFCYLIFASGIFSFLLKYTWVYFMLFPFFLKRIFSFSSHLQWILFCFSTCVHCSLACFVYCFCRHDLPCSVPFILPDLVGWFPNGRKTLPFYRVINYHPKGLSFSEMTWSYFKCLLWSWEPFSYLLSLVVKEMYS